MSTSLERWLALPGCDPEEHRALAARARALRVGVLACAAADLLYDGYLALGGALVVCALASLHERTTRSASLLAFALFTGVVVASAPFVANHDYLKWILFALFAFLRPLEAREQRLLVQATRWLVVLVFLWSGLKKALFGAYFGGEFLAYMIGTSVRFSDFFSLLLPAAEIARLQGYAGELGSGPYRVDGWLFPLLSNAVWLGEIAVGLTLLWARARPWAWVLGLGMLFGIEFVAREVFFGLLFTTLLLAFPAAPWLVRALPWLVATQVLIVGSSWLGLRVEGLT